MTPKWIGKTPVIITLLIIFLISGCTCCLYYNHLFNARRSWHQVNTMHAQRMAIASDTSWVTEPEKELLERVLTKCGKILELWPNDVQYKPEVLYLMSHAFYKQGNWSEAITKTDELERYFPDHDSIPLLQFQRAFAYVQLSQLLQAGLAIEPLMTPDHPYHLLAMELFAHLAVLQGNPTEAINALRQILQDPASTTAMRIQARVKLVQLLKAQEQLTSCHQEAFHPELTDAPTKIMEQLALNGLDCALQIPNAEVLIHRSSELLQIDSLQALHGRILVYKIRGLLMQQEVAAADSLLILLKMQYSQNAPAGFFLTGRYHEAKLQLNQALYTYNGCVLLQSNDTTTIQQCRQRADLIKRVQAAPMALDSTPQAQKTSLDVAGLIAVDLNQPEQSLKILDSLIKNPSLDSSLYPRLWYVQAYILGDLMGQKAQARQWYTRIMQTYPQTPYARQAALNTGLPLGLQTRADSAKAAFTQWEDSLFYIKDSVPTNAQPAAFKKILPNLEWVATHYKITEYAAKALLLKAHVAEFYLQDTATARTTYQELAKWDYEPYTSLAQEKLSPGTIKTSRELRSLHQAVLRAQQDLEEYRYILEEMERNRPVEAPKEEFIEWDYDAMYNW